jgi:hypothetical protein
MAGYHRKCGRDGERPTTFKLWLDAEPCGKASPRVTPSGVLNLHAAARAILLEDGQDPRRDLGPPVHSWGMWSGTYIDEDPRLVTRAPGL